MVNFNFNQKELGEKKSREKKSQISCYLLMDIKNTNRISSIVNIFLKDIPHTTRFQSHTYVFIYLMQTSPEPKKSVQTFCDVYKVSQKIRKINDHK